MSEENFNSRQSLDNLEKSLRSASGLEEENSILRKEILKLHETIGAQHYGGPQLNRFMELFREITEGLTQKTQINDELSRQFDEINNEFLSQKEELRELIDKKVVEIERKIYNVIIGCEDCLSSIKTQSYERSRDVLMEQIKIVTEKMSEFETIIIHSQDAYRLKINQLLESRKEAEIQFLEERAKFASILQELEKAYEIKAKSVESTISQELNSMKELYFKVKYENGILIVLNTRAAVGQE